MRKAWRKVLVTALCLSMMLNTQIVSVSGEELLSVKNLQMEEAVLSEEGEMTQQNETNEESESQQASELILSSEMDVNSGEELLGETKADTDESDIDAEDTGSLLSEQGLLNASDITYE